MNNRNLQHGLIVIHGNHIESLRDMLVSWMHDHPLPVLENEVILVQSNGIGQWLKLALARDPAQGGCGVAAALDVQLPAHFFWQVYRALLGREQVPETSLFDKPLLVWRLMRLLPQQLKKAEFAPLARFLQRDDDMRKLHQLAQQLADMFDQYQVYRADWLAAWAENQDILISRRYGRQPLPEEQRWQPMLWRRLLVDSDRESETSRAALHQRFLQMAHQLPEGQRVSGLPSRVMVFGISSLPQQALDVLAAIGRWTQVFVCVHNPCEYYWGDIIADKDLLRAARIRQQRKPGLPVVSDPDGLHQHAHPLLAAWGKQGRDYIGLLDEYDQQEADHIAVPRIDFFNSNGTDTLLHQLQEDIRLLRPLSETRMLWPAVDARQDNSVSFHIAHSAQREVEILHDQLLAAMAHDPVLQPRDIIVMVPDINGYAPHIQAVFGMMERKDPRYIPFNVADQGPRQNNVLPAALEKLLSLPQLRFAVSDLLDLLDVPAVRHCFAIAEDQLPLLQRWIEAANVRWGLHAAQRQSLALPAADEQNSWFFGLRRMLLGYAVGSGDAWQHIEPLDEIGGLDAVLVGQLSSFLAALDTTWRELQQTGTPAEWGARLRQLLARFFLAEEDNDGFILMQMDDTLQCWLDACEQVAPDLCLPLSVVRDHWLAQFEQTGLMQPFLGGAVTFATLMPMRAIPFRYVCLLGMNDGDYPRNRVPFDFDLMGQDYRPGDRSRREDDRYLFLEALLSARQHLHVSWVGRSIYDNSERPPSVLVAQLRDHLAAGWQLASGGDLLAALTTEHRLQPFSRDYFSSESPLFSYAREWRAGLIATVPPISETTTALSPPVQESPLTLHQLADFLRDPVRAFFRQRLNVFFESDSLASHDQEPFSVDALQNWRLQDELIRAQKNALLHQQPRDIALRQQLARIARRGELAPGGFSSVLSQALAAPMDALFERYEAALVRWPLRGDNEEIITTDAGTALSDWLDDLRTDADGNRCRVVLESSGLIKNRRYRWEKILPFWVTHLAGHLNGEPMYSEIISKNGTVSLPALAPLQARDHWQALIDAWVAGMRRPLPLAIKTAFCWLEQGGQPGQSSECDAWGQAQRCYEHHDPQNLTFSERDSNRYLARSWPDFVALWADGEFACLAEALLAPLYLTLKTAGTQGARS